MKIEKVRTAKTSNTFTAKIEKRADFAANKFRVYFDGTLYHCYGLEEENDPRVFRTLYFHVQLDPSTRQPTLVLMSYIARSGYEFEKAHTRDGSFTIDFDTQADHYKMSFHAVVNDPVAGDIDILGSFDLRM